MGRISAWNLNRPLMWSLGWLIGFIWITQCLVPCEGLHIVSPGPAKGYYLATPSWQDWGPKSFNYSAIELIEWQPHNGPEDYDFRQGKAWLIRTNGSNGDEEFLLKTWKSGERPAAVVFIAGWKTPAGAGNWIRFQSGQHHDVKIAALQIEFWDWYKLQYIVQSYNNASYPCFVSITSGEPNPWDDMMHHFVNWIFWFAIMGTLYGSLVAYGIYKMTKLVKRRGWQFSIPQIIIAFETFANSIRFLWTIIDPIFCRRVFPPLMQQILLTFTFPFTVFSSLLVTLYWYELMRKSQLKPSTTLSKMKVPFILFFSLFLAAELASSISRGLGVVDFFYKIVLGVSCFYVIVILSVIVFFMITGIILIETLRKSFSGDQQNSKAMKKLIQTTKLILMSIFGQAGFVIVVLVMAVTFYLYQPWSMWLLWALAYVFMSFISCMFLIAVHVPSPILPPHSHSRTVP